AQAGVTWAWLGQDGTQYFDLHHNANDTLDKVDPQDLAQNTAAYVVLAYLAAEAEGDFGSAPRAGDDREQVAGQPQARERAQEARKTAVAAATLRLSTAPVPGIETRRSHACARPRSIPSPSAPMT